MLRFFQRLTTPNSVPAPITTGQHRKSAAKIDTLLDKIGL
jgi:hypothetical protein